MMKIESPLMKASASFAHKGHQVWAEIAPEFKSADFKNPYRMDAAFLRWLVKVRREAGVPMWITSDSRDPEADIGAEKSAHDKVPCRAIDGQVKDLPNLLGSEQLARIVIAAVKLGCARVGIYKSTKGLGDIYHLDCETHPDNPSPRLWTKW